MFYPKEDEYSEYIKTSTSQKVIRSWDVYKIQPYVQSFKTYEEAAEMMESKKQKMIFTHLLRSPHKPQGFDSRVVPKSQNPEESQIVADLGSQGQDQAPVLEKQKSVMMATVNDNGTDSRSPSVAVSFLVSSTCFSLF